MSKTTILRGNIVAYTLVQAALPSTTIAGTSSDVTFTVPGVKSTDAVLATFDGALVTGISVGNAYTNADNKVIVRLINSTGASATQTAGTMLIQVMTCEDSPIPTSVA